jgi:hypothetical protein
VRSWVGPQRPFGMTTTHRRLPGPLGPKLVPRGRWPQFHVKHINTASCNVNIQLLHVVNKLSDH